MNQGTTRSLPFLTLLYRYSAVIFGHVLAKWDRVNDFPFIANSDSCEHLSQYLKSLTQSCASLILKPEPITRQDHRGVIGATGGERDVDQVLDLQSARIAFVIWAIRSIDSHEQPKVLTAAPSSEKKLASRVSARRKELKVRGRLMLT